MSLRHALLGLLAEGPASGWDLARRFEGDLGRYAWQAGHTRIYPELVRMADEGLVAVESTGARGRKSYVLTDPGRTELHRWLRRGPDEGVVRNETVLRMFLVQTLEPDDARAMLAEIAEHARTERDRLRAVMAQTDAEHGTGGLPFGRLAGEYGARLLDAVVGWSEWSTQRLDQVAPAESPGAPSGAPPDARSDARSDSAASASRSTG